VATGKGIKQLDDSIARAFAPALRDDFVPDWIDFQDSPDGEMPDASGMNGLKSMQSISDTIFQIRGRFGPAISIT